MLIFSLLLSFRTFLLLVHPFYVSITEAKYNGQSQRLEIGCRIFYDDLEVALAAEGNDKIDIIKPQNRVQVDSILSRYLRQHLKLKVNGRPNSLTYVGYQIENDVAWCFLESTALPDLKSVQFINELLYNQFKNQTNIMHIVIGKTRKSIKLDNPKSQVTLNF